MRPLQGFSLQFGIVFLTIPENASKSFPCCGVRESICQATSCLSPHALPPGLSSGRRGQQRPMGLVFVPQRILQGRTGSLKVVCSLLPSPAGPVFSSGHIVGLVTRGESRFPALLVHLRCTRHWGRQQPPTL